ncbi:MAG: hypothetical protein ABIW83_07200, partial [Allosphingosinicella sp.]
MTEVLVTTSSERLPIGALKTVGRRGKQEHGGRRSALSAQGLDQEPVDMAPVELEPSVGIRLLLRDDEVGKSMEFVEDDEIGTTGRDRQGYQRKRR